MKMISHPIKQPYTQAECDSIRADAKRCRAEERRNLEFARKQAKFGAPADVVDRALRLATSYGAESIASDRIADHMQNEINSGRLPHMSFPGPFEE